MVLNIAGNLGLEWSHSFMLAIIPDFHHVHRVPRPYLHVTHLLTSRFLYPELTITRQRPIFGEILLGCELVQEREPASLAVAHHLASAPLGPCYWLIVPPPLY